MKSNHLLEGNSLFKTSLALELKLFVSCHEVIANRGAGAASEGLHRSRKDSDKRKLLPDDLLHLDSQPSEVWK